MKLWFQECSKPSHKASQFQTTPILNCCFCHPRFILKLELLVFLEWIVEENRKNLKRLWYGHDFSSFSMMMRMRMIDVCLCIWSSPLGGVWASLTSTKAEQGAVYWKDFAHLDFLSVAPDDYLDLSTWRLSTIFIGPESDHWLCLSLTDWLTDWLLFSKLDWCRPGRWRWQLKTCWSCWYWETV